METPVGPSYADRLKATLETPGFLEEFCAHVANGGDYITFCKMRDISYSDFYVWLNDGKSGRTIALAKAERAREEWVRNRILNELRILALTDLRDAFRKDGSLKKPEDWPESIARALAGVDTEELFSGHGRDREFVGYTKKLRLHNKVEALKLIGQEFGLFVQKHKVEVSQRLEDLVGESWQEAEVVPPTSALPPPAA